MALSWKARKQIFYFLIVFFILAVGAVLFGFITHGKFSKGTCFDDKKNQGEEQADCGGPCNPCPYNLKEPVVIWTRFFRENGANNTYDIAAKIENPNKNWGSKELIYSFKLYDKDDILITEKEGKTFINPGEKIIIFENSIFSGSREPKRVSFKVSRNKWEYSERLSPDFLVVKKEFNKSSSVLTAEVKNNSAIDAKNIYVTAALMDKNGNVFAITSTKIDNILSGEKETAVFSWQTLFQNEPSLIEVIPRMDIMEE